MCPRRMRSGHLRSGEIALRSGEIPGQQFLYAVDRVIGDLFEYAAEVEFRVKPIELGCSQQRIDRGCALTPCIGSTEQEILPAQSYGTQSPLGGRVVHFDPAIVEIARERTPTRQRIANRPQPYPICVRAA